MDHADAFFLTQGGIGLPYRRRGATRADVGLTDEAERRESRPLRRHVEFGELHLTHVTALLPGVVTTASGFVGRDRRDEGRPEGFVHRGEIALHLDV